MGIVSPHISIINNHPKCKRTESTSEEAQSSGIDYKTGSKWSGGIQRKSGVPILVSDKIDFKRKKVMRQR